MEIILAKSAGFCFGVKRALEKIEELLAGENDKKIFTYGPIIHNEQVVDDLKKRGVGVINDISQIPEVKGCTLVLRSHGAAKEVYDTCVKNEVDIVDATCPFVRKIQKIVSERTAAGEPVVIVGNPAHPEVSGIVGWARGEVSVIENENDTDSFDSDGELLKNGRKITIVSQTTQSMEKFQTIVEKLKRKGYSTDVMNTICRTASTRQSEASDISRKVDKMIVIGGRKSSNTQRLFEICKHNCADTYYIQTFKDLSQVNLQSTGCVGITAGASTPNHIIQEVLLYVRGDSLQ